jgi:hypothetical protein
MSKNLPSPILLRQGYAGQGLRQAGALLQTFGVVTHRGILPRAGVPPLEKNRSEYFTRDISAKMAIFHHSRRFDFAPRIL